MVFRYPKLQFIVRFFLLLMMLVGISLLLLIPDTDMAWPAFFIAVFFVATTVTTLSPIFTAHELRAEGMILRHGILFKATFAFSDIQAVERFTTRLWAFGVMPSGARGRIVLASTNSGLVSIKLKERRRFGMLLLRSSDEIIIDLEKPDEFVKMVNEKHG